jgi:hypothetical protein
MAAAARDYLAVPAAEVDVERLFNSGQDLLGLQRWSLSSKTMRKLLILKDFLRNNIYIFTFISMDITHEKI